MFIIFINNQQLIIIGLTCAGHGTCRVPDFPYGTCIHDLEDFVADALYTPHYILQSNQTGYNGWIIHEGSIMTELRTNTSYYFRDARTEVRLYRQFGTTFDTCSAVTKFVYEDGTFDIVENDTLVDKVVFTMTMFSFAANTTYTITNASTLHAYSHCRNNMTNLEWYNNTLYTSAPPCIVSWTWSVSQSDIRITAISTPIEFVCVTANTLDALKESPYGSLKCNNVYHRIIDKSIWLNLGKDQYDLQCESQPIGPYSNVLGAEYGLFETFNTTRVARVLGNRWVPFDELNEKFFDDYVISWTSAYMSTVNETNFGNLTSMVPMTALLQVLLGLGEIFSSGVVYDFLDEKWVFNYTDAIGTPLRHYNLTKPVVESTFVNEMFNLGRSYSPFYRKKGTKN